MKTTANYGLKKPEGTDVVNIEDLNYNADIIDTQIKSLNDKKIDYGTASGTNTYTVTIPGATLTEGRSYKIKFTNANTGAATLNINGLGAKSIVKSNGNALSSGNIKAGQILHLVYTGSVFQLLGEGGEYGTATADKVLTGYTIGTESGIVSGTMPNNSGKVQEVVYTYSEEGFVRLRPPKGYYDEAVGSSIQWTDENFKRENIKPGVTIFGQTGTFTSDANATAGQILSGQTAYVKGNKVTGTMPNNGAKIITPSTTNQAIPVGYHNGSGYVKGDANLKPENIKDGVSIFGVTGSVVEGDYKIGDIIYRGRVREVEIPFSGWSSVEFTSPVRSIAVDNSYNVYVGEDYGRNVRKLSPSGSQLWIYSSNDAYIEDLAIDSSGNIIVGTRGLKKLSPNGGLLWNFIQFTGDLKSVAVDSSDNVYGGANDKTLRKISPSGVQLWSKTLSSSVNGVVVDTSDNVYGITYYGDIVKYSSDGTQIWSKSVSMSDCIATIDGLNNLYIGGDSKIVKLDANGNQVWTHDKGAAALATDEFGNIYYTYGTSLSKLSSDGVLLWELKNLHINNLWAVTTDSEGAVYAGIYNRVDKLSSSGSKTTDVGFKILK